MIKQDLQLTRTGYCLHCKGKSHKKLEFGSKVSFAVIPKTNIIVGVKDFNGNSPDSNTLESMIQHAQNEVG
jgi:transposase, IS5 family